MCKKKKKKTIDDQRQIGRVVRPGDVVDKERKKKGGWRSRRPASM